jgi:hypothetical protein
MAMEGAPSAFPPWRGENEVAGFLVRLVTHSLQGLHNVYMGRVFFPQLFQILGNFFELGI